MFFGGGCGQLRRARAERGPAILLIAALATVFFFPGYDRDQPYRGERQFFPISGIHFAVAANLSPEHGFLQFHGRYVDHADGEPMYVPYHRFPPLGYALIKLVGLPFGTDLAARLYATRMLMLVLFSGAALLAYFSLRRLAAQRACALTATLFAFGSYPLLYYGDTVAPDAVIGLFSVMLAFHGIAVHSCASQATRDVRPHAGGSRHSKRASARAGQLYAKTCAAFLFDWHVCGLLLPFLLVAVPHAAYNRDWRGCRRYLLLGVATALVGFAMLAFNLMREYHGLGGSTPLFELPTWQSLLRRTGVSPLDPIRYSVDWAAVLQDQLRRIGEAALPWALAEPLFLVAGSATMWQRVGGGLLAFALLAICWPGTRHRIAWSGLALCGMGWALPMRHQVQQHEFEVLFHVGTPLVACALVLTRFQARVAEFAGRRADRATKTAMVATGLALFVASSWLVANANVGDDAEAQRGKMLFADWRDIQRHTRGKVAHVPPTTPSWVHMAALIGMGGIRASRGRDAEFVVAIDTPRSTWWHPPLLNPPASSSVTPRNRMFFLYRRSVYYAELDRAIRYLEDALKHRQPVVESPFFDVYEVGDALLYVGEGDRCRVEVEHRNGPFFLHVYPVDVNNLPERFRRDGFANLNFRRDPDWARDGRCFAWRLLPKFPIGQIHTGQYRPTREGYDSLWEGRFSPRRGQVGNADGQRTRPSEREKNRAEYQRIVGGDPLARSVWDVFLLSDGGGEKLAFLKRPCAVGDAAARFLVHVVPVDARDLPLARRRLRFDNWDFHFAERGGVLFDGRCMVWARLPDYDIATIRVGQYSSAGPLWAEELPVARAPIAPP